jgi:hypothetical protein
MAEAVGPQETDALPSGQCLYRGLCTDGAHPPLAEGQATLLKLVLNIRLPF